MAHMEGFLCPVCMVEFSCGTDLTTHWQAIHNQNTPLFNEPEGKTNDSKGDIEVSKLKSNVYERDFLEQKHTSCKSDFSSSK